VLLFVGDDVVIDQAGLERSSDRGRNAGLSQVCQDHQTRQRRRLAMFFVILDVSVS